VVIYQRKVWVKAMLDLALHNGEGPVALKVLPSARIAGKLFGATFATLKRLAILQVLGVHREAICFPKTLTVLQ